jgi:hypothetical protein
MLKGHGPHIDFYGARGRCPQTPFRSIEDMRKGNMKPLSQPRLLKHILAILLGVTVIAAADIPSSLSSEQASDIPPSVSTDSVQQNAFLMHDGDTLSTIVNVPEGTYMVVKSDQGNQAADVLVTESGGFVVEKDAVLVLENVNFSGGNIDRSMPVFCVYGDMVMNDGAVAGFSSTSAGTSSVYGNGGIPAICVVGGTFTMNGGVIFGNSNTTTKEAAFGGALRAEGINAAVIINGGTISGNQVLSSAAVQGDLTVSANALGGAIAVTEGASVTISGGEISENTAGSHEANAEDADYPVCSGNGGAIAVYSSGSEAISSLYLEGGSILNNYAYRTGGDEETAEAAENQTHGGGIFSNIYTRAVLNSGRIAGNISDDKGGGLFLDCDKSFGGALFKNTLVSGNEALVLGGGLWFCPDGEADMFSLAKADGIAIFDNTTARRGTDGAGDDLYVSPRSGSTGVTLTSIMPGGGSNAWYQDGGAGTPKTSSSSSRYAASYAVQPAVLLQASAVVNRPTEEARASAEESATVVITGNRATYGGGVGSNHYLVFGTPTPEEEKTYNVPSATPTPKISINVKKVWIGDAGTAAAVHLLANGTETASATLTADNGWAHTFTDLDQVDSEGNEITYSVAEDAIDGYISEISGDAASGFTVTNTNKKINISVTKTWIGDAGTEATVHLLANGAEAASTSLTEENGWAYTFADLDRFDSIGNEIAYTLTEDAIDGYVSEISGDAASGFTVTNTSKKINISVTKTWVGEVGTEATVRLVANGTEAASATLNTDSNWSYTFTDCDRFDSEGNEIDYSVTEDDVDGYISEVSGDAKDGFTVTNTETLTMHVQKNWESVTNEVSVTVRLIRNGVSTDTTITITADTDTVSGDRLDGWSNDFSDLPKYDASGNEIVYTVVEEGIYWSNDSTNYRNSYGCTSQCTSSGNTITCTLWNVFSGGDG